MYVMYVTKVINGLHWMVIEQNDSRQKHFHVIVSILSFHQRSAIVAVRWYLCKYCRSTTPLFLSFFYDYYHRSLHSGMARQTHEKKMREKWGSNECAVHPMWCWQRASAHTHTYTYTMPSINELMLVDVLCACRDTGTLLSQRNVKQSSWPYTTILT